MNDNGFKRNCADFSIWHLVSLLIVCIAVGAYVIFKSGEQVNLHDKQYEIRKKVFIIDNVSPSDIYTINLIDPDTNVKYEVLFDSNTCRQATKELRNKKEYAFEIKVILNKRTNIASTKFVNLSNDICGYQ